MTTNATVDDRHKDEAAEAFGYSSWTRLSHSEGPRITAIALAQAQDKANLEAARAGNADLTNRLAEIDRQLGMYSCSACDVARKLASDHTKTPCPPESCKDCAAKDAEIAIWQGKAETFGRACSEKDEAITKAMDLGVTEEAWDVLKPYRIPPADPLAEALKAAVYAYGGEMLDGENFDRALAELKSRLGGAK